MATTAARGRDRRPKYLELAYGVRQAEDAAAAAVRQIPSAARHLGRGPRRVNRTRAGSEDRLAQAVAAAVRAGREDARWRSSAGQAASAWAEAERLRWALAMTAAPIARQEARRHVGPFLDEEDLLQEGYIGLLRAAQRFDPDRGVPFRAYARWWVRASMSRAVDRKGRPIRLPACAAEQIRATREAADALRAAGRVPSDQAIARELGLALDRVRELRACGYVTSMDALREQGAAPLRPAPPPQEERLAVVRRQAQLRGACERLLTERQRDVIYRRYGLHDGEGHTLAEIGRALGVTKERVRQIERDALTQLRRRGELSALNSPA